MNWRVRSLVQGAIALLPSAISYEVYYRLQRRLGGLQRADPTPWLKTGAAIVARLTSLGFDCRDKAFLEVGTGRAPLLPLVYWLLGAGRVHTVDLNPYLKAEMLAEYLQWMVSNPEDVRAALGERLIEERMRELEGLTGKTLDLDRFFDITSIRYVAPGDAAAIDLPAHSIDFHTSYTVLEHIPEAVLRGILREGGRLLRPTGAFVHLVDFSDHFSHADPALSSVNFLRFSEAWWRFYSGNRYMYMNRLRYDDYQALFGDVANVVFEDPAVDQAALALLESGRFSIARRFRSKSIEVLATRNAWFIATPRPHLG